MESMPYELDKALILKDKTRKKLQRIHGELISENDLKSLNGDIICVGDVVTSTLLNHGIKPKIAIVDYRTQRGEAIYENVKNFGAEILKVTNPPGTITPEMWNAVKKAINSKRNIKIEVNGEEDLAVIPVVYFAEIGANVIYGMPNTGLVLIKITEEDKAKVYEIIKEMEV